MARDLTSPLVVDTDLVIDFLRGRGPGADAMPVWIRRGDLRLTVITLFELLRGDDWQRRADRIERLFTSAPMPLDALSARSAGALELELRSRGHSIGVADSLQAGICLSRGLPLATRNRRHFERVPGLELAVLPT